MNICLHRNHNAKAQVRWGISRTRSQVAWRGPFERFEHGRDILHTSSHTFRPESHSFGSPGPPSAIHLNSIRSVENVSLVSPIENRQASSWVVIEPFQTINRPVRRHFIAPIELVQIDRDRIVVRLPRCQRPFPSTVAEPLGQPADYDDDPSPHPASAGTTSESECLGSALHRWPRLARGERGSVPYCPLPPFRRYVGSGLSWPADPLPNMPGTGFHAQQDSSGRPQLFRARTGGHWDQDQRAGA